MVITNQLANYIMFGSYRIAPGASQTIADSVYNTDDILAEQINSAYAIASISVSSTPAGFPRDVPDWWNPGGTSSSNPITAADIIDHVLVDNPRVLWACQEESGQLQDSSGNGLHSTTVTSVAYRPDIHDPTGNSFCIYLPAGGNVSRTAVTTAVNNITLEFCWLPLSYNAGHVLFGNWNGSTNGYYLYTPAANKFGVVLAGVGVLAQCSATIPTGQWQHIVVRRSSNQWSYWINGVLDSSPSTGTPSTPSGAITALSSGNSNAGGYAYAAIFETALADARIQARASLLGLT